MRRRAEEEDRDAVTLQVESETRAIPPRKVGVWRRRVFQNDTTRRKLYTVARRMVYTGHRSDRNRPSFRATRGETKGSEFVLASAIVAASVHFGGRSAANIVVRGRLASEIEDGPKIEKERDERRRFQGKRKEKTTIWLFSWIGKNNNSVLLSVDIGTST